MEDLTLEDLKYEELVENILNYQAVRGRNSIKLQKV
jgi:hypothetical protein